MAECLHSKSRVYERSDKKQHREENFKKQNQMVLGLKKIKKGEAYSLFILYILIFCSL